RKLSGVPCKVSVVVFITSYIASARRSRPLVARLRRARFIRVHSWFNFSIEPRDRDSRFALDLDRLLCAVGLKAAA
ncbi:MAG TPA: hypothetical protein VGO11_03170, partial [Chthoniobacteraceae bacterium]|nr:hypothetical protein [Chthoniobacteraceae bacterium]